MTNQKIKLIVEDFLSYRLSVVSRLINRRSTRYFNERYGLTLAEWRALSQIAMGKNITAKAVAGHTYADKAQVSRAITHLQTKGLVGSRPNPADKRSVELFLTKDGQQLHDKLLPMREDENKLIGSILSRKELESLNDMLIRIQSHLVDID